MKFNDDFSSKKPFPNVRARERAAFRAENMRLRQNTESRPLYSI